MEQLIIEALKSACGNRNIKFQVIVRDNQLHIYANHRKEYQPNYSILKENVGSAVVALDLPIDDVWLYGRPLGQLEANWQSRVELSDSASDADKDTEGSQSNLDSTVDFDSKDEFNFVDGGSDAGWKPNSSNLVDELDLTDFVEFEEDSCGDTGLLRDTGLIHGNPLKEAEIATFYDRPAESPLTTETSSKSIEQYCFIVNKKLLSGATAPPNKDMMRKIKFLHHLGKDDRQKLLPILDSYFRLGTTPGLESTLPAVQNWFKAVKALTETERDIFAVWLSRYCANPEETLTEFKAIAANNTAEQNKKQSNRSTEYSFVKIEDYAASSTVDDEPLATAKFQLPPAIKNNLLPLVWLCGTLMFIVLGIINHNSNLVAASAQIPPLCQNAISSPEYCRLGVNLAGTKAIAQSPESLFPLTEVTETIADYGCARYANLKAGVDLSRLAPETTPVVASQGEKIFPHIYTVVVEQQNAQQPGKTKVGCVYTSGQGQRSPKQLATDVIPTEWPKIHYQQQQNGLAAGIYAGPIELGLRTIFAALGIAVVARLNLGLRIARANTVYLVALLLGLAQLTVALLPASSWLNSMVAIAMPILVLVVASLCFKGFQLNWQRSYSLVAVSVLMVVAIQFLFYGLCMGSIASLV